MLYSVVEREKNRFTLPFDSVLSAPPAEHGKAQGGMEKRYALMFWPFCTVDVV
ncbi:MAG TPA: hypothetical protein VIG57_07620 [Candidatus Entotheonella sp.]